MLLVDDKRAIWKILDGIQKEIGPGFENRCGERPTTYNCSPMRNAGNGAKLL